MKERKIWVMLGISEEEVKRLLVAAANVTDKILFTKEKNIYRKKKKD